MHNRHWYENGAQLPHIVIPAKSLPRTPIRAGIQSQRRGSQSRLRQWAGPIFIPLCGLRKAMVIPAKSLPRTPIRAGIQSQRRGSQSRLRQWAGPIFIPLCGLRKAMVIPAKSLPRTRYGAGIQRAVSQLGLRRSGPPMLICLRSYSVVSGCRAGQGIGRARTVRD